MLAFLAPPPPVVAAEQQPAVPPEGPPSAGGQPPVAPSAKPAVADPDYKATAKIPRKLLQQVVGCWRLDGQERWTISRLDASGAQVTTKLLGGKVKPPFPDRARRAAVPATLMYDTRAGNFGFTAAGKYYTSLVVFNRSGANLEASLYSKRSKKEHFSPTGDTATLLRCGGHKATSPPRRSPTPPRLK
jgi:hypothetical protein